MKEKSLEVGMKAPNFIINFSDGSKESLRDYLGQKVLICFYPKDNTPGCTLEVCSLSDSSKEFKKKKIKVFGISKDSEKSHQNFINKYKLKLSLVPDQDLKIITSFGVLNEKGSARRVSFLLDEKGEIINIWRKVNTREHAKEVLEFIGS
ncbi:peroxiredoxin [bacterium]|jgi:peroxiredoxin Q/BCP|nr:peroxiredoxin [bacterium]MBT3849991.1 peroxiredoxin [bacterium]MBT4435453.1 peroxiredoxin [bacterium]|tara:strand:- start:100 stop:549 length:450 start_codon:yes stop_codon:yes gene_type:complete